MTWEKYNLINSPELIKKLDDYLMNPDGTPKFPLTSYDTETNGLQYFKTSVIGFSLAVDKFKGFYIPILVWVPDPKSKKTKTKDKVKMDVFTDGHLLNIWTGKIHPEFVQPKDVDFPEWLPAILERWFGKSQLFMWNAPFDVNHTYINFGVDLKNQLVADGGLLVHVKDENESVGLKESAVVYSKQLGINPYVMADQEKKELKGSIILNGGSGREVWRADLEPQMKYACADTFLTHGLVEVVMQEIAQERQEQYPAIEKWIFEDEVMPVCKEVVIDMKRRGVYTDTKHFQKLFDQNAKKLLELEDEFMKSIAPYMDTFDKGESLDEAISHQRLVKRIIELEGLSIPQVLDKKTGEYKESIAKAAVKKAYEENPHWIWGYLLDQDEIKYSPSKVQEIKQQLYEEVVGRRYRFNVGSNDHLIWLFFDKLGENKRKFPKTDGSTVEDWRPSIDADGIKQHLLPKYPWVNSLLKYKKILKMQSTYISPALELHIDGWLYMDMKQNGTTSGRFSCSGGYNLQTLPSIDNENDALNECHKCEAKRFKKDGTETGLIFIDQYIECMANRECRQCGHVEQDIPCPSSIKKGFIAPPGYKIINADYSSLEPRCFAYESREEKIKEVYKQGLDLYSKVYCDMFDKDGQYSADPNAPNFLKKVYNAGRKRVKPIVLGIPYGAGDAQCANMIGAVIVAKEPNEHGVYEERPDMVKGKEIRDQYLATYPNLQQYMTHQEYMAIEYGYVEAKYGRRRHFMWAKKIGDFFGEINSHNGFVQDKIDKIQWFIKTSKKKLSATAATIKDPDSGNIVMNLTEEDLQRLCDSLGMSLSMDKYGKDGVKQKGGWAYIRSLIKADMNNAKNHPIQGLAGHITNMGMLETQRRFRANGLDAWVALQVHDEISCYAREDHAEMAKDCLRLGMEENIYTIPLRDDVVMIAEPVICDNLKESK
jgi:DNA polymerase I-like protein with 3'-5' exonuclease and polymerase domains